MKYKTHQSTDSVNFLDVEVRIRNNTIQTSVFSKPTDAHLYLNSSSCLPSHVTRNIPKGQFTRIRRICTNIEDYIQHGRQLSKYFLKRGYKRNAVEKAYKEILKTDRNAILLTLRKNQAKPTIHLCLHLAHKGGGAYGEAVRRFLPLLMSVNR